MPPFRHGAVVVQTARSWSEQRSTKPTSSCTVLTAEAHIARAIVFGGRVECFETGVIEGDFSVFDVNSMYPFCMKTTQHPTGKNYVTGYNREIDAKGNIDGFENFPVYFAAIECDQRGAFPMRRPGQSRAGRAKRRGRR